MDKKFSFNFPIFKSRFGTIHFSNSPYFLIHLIVPVAAFFVPFHWYLVGLAFGLYFIRMFFVTGFYHRYFSHRGFKARGRVVQFMMALAGTTCVQMGPLWWARHHRHHHLYSDTEQDLHSPKQQGFWHSHFGWIFTVEQQPFYDDKKVLKDLDVPELHWINKYWLIGPVLLGVGLFAIGGASWLVWGLGISTLMLWHGTYTINSLSHVFGKERFVTGDTSKNNFFLALVTLGEGWHNNHHAYQAGAKAGFYFWEIDITYYMLRCMQFMGLIYKLGAPPEKILALGRLNDENRRAAKRLVKGRILRRLDAHDVQLLLQAIDKFIDRTIVKKLKYDDLKRMLKEFEAKHLSNGSLAFAT